MNTFERGFSVLPSEEEEARQRAIAMGADPEKAAEALRAKAEGATTQIGETSAEDAGEKARQSLERAFQVSWDKMTAEQREKIRARYFES